MRPLLLAWLACLVALPALADPAGWQKVDERGGPDGHTLYRRQLPGSRVAAFRLEGSVDVPIARVLEARQAGEDAPASDDDGPQRRLLRREGDVILTYTFMPLPLLADRDLVLRQEHSQDPATGIHRFVWHTIEGEGPPPPEGVVRIQRSEGMWEFTPQGDARTRLVLESLTDVGGSLPAWVVNSFYPSQLRHEWNGLIGRIRTGNPRPR
jgi:hypothetical protein